MAMRLVKLSTDEFPEETDLHTYFREELPARNPPGLFLFGHQIASDGLEVGETLLFCYRGNIRYVATVETTRMDSPPAYQDAYPNCLVIRMESVRRTDVPLTDLERELRQNADLKKSLQGRGWTKIPGGNRAEKVIEALVNP
jgi:hypothetical protein